MKAFLAIYHLK